MTKLPIGYAEGFEPLTQIKDRGRSIASTDQNTLPKIKREQPWHVIEKENAEKRMKMLKEPRKITLSKKEYNKRYAEKNRKKLSEYQKQWRLKQKEKQ